MIRTSSMSEGDKCYERKKNKSRLGGLGVLVVAEGRYYK